MDNPRPLVVRDDVVSRSVQFKTSSSALGLPSCTCARQRARTKGKTENGVE
jgi:hypothetical protein